MFYTTTQLPVMLRSSQIRKNSCSERLLLCTTPAVAAPPQCLRRRLPSEAPWSASQKHFRCTMVGPDSSYSCFEIHICWKVLREERMEPPIHTEYFRSGGATTLIFIVEGASAVSSFVMRSPMPANIVVPPESTLE